MGIGVSVFLLALGAILTFAVNATVSGVDINAVGVILMLAGAVGLLVDLLIFAPRRRAVGVADRGVVTEERVVRSDREVY